jgi:hypothetical protein
VTEPGEGCVVQLYSVLRTYIGCEALADRSTIGGSGDLLVYRTGGWQSSPDLGEQNEAGTKRGQQAETMRTRTRGRWLDEANQSQKLEEASAEVERAV